MSLQLLPGRNVCPVAGGDAVAGMQQGGLRKGEEREAWGAPGGAPPGDRVRPEA